MCMTASIYPDINICLFENLFWKVQVHLVSIAVEVVAGEKATFLSYTRSKRLVSGGELRLWPYHLADIRVRWSSPRSVKTNRTWQAQSYRCTFRRTYQFLSDKREFINGFLRSCLKAKWCNFMVLVFFPFGYCGFSCVSSDQSFSYDF